MKIRDLVNNQIVQSLVIILLVVAFLFAELTTYLVAGQINVILTQVFYLPVIFFSFRFAKRAVLTATVMATVYLVLVMLTSGNRV